MSSYAFRTVVRTEPIPIYIASEVCTVHVWAPLLRSDGEENPACMCEISKEKPDSTKVGLSLSDTVIIPFHLLPGETFWAWSTGEGLINVSVIPML